MFPAARVFLKGALQSSELSSITCLGRGAMSLNQLYFIHIVVGHVVGATDSKRLPFCLGGIDAAGTPVR